MDPIDGTRDFLRDLPTWSNLIALEVDGEVVLGVCNLVLTLTAFPDLAPVPFADRMIDYMSGYWAVRSMGGCQDAVLVMSGRAEAWIELNARAWELARSMILAEEAGCRFFNFDGGHSIHGGNAVICAPFLEDELRELVRPAAG